MNKIDLNNKYTKMQLQVYTNNDVDKWSIENPDFVVGSFHEHNNWRDYENLFTNIKDLSEKVGLDFACGPGRNIVKYSNRFKRLDGVDISYKCIEKAKQYTSDNKIQSNLFISNGVDLSIIEDNSYDVIMSTIALQHICVYEIRKNIFTEMFRILKNGGYITIQMGYGSNSPKTVGYYENFYDAKETNRGCDVCIENPEQIEKDLIEIGFKNFNYKITQVGPGDGHPNWIFFNAQK